MCPIITSASYLTRFDCKLTLLLIKLNFVRVIIQEQDLLESATLQGITHLFITKQIIVSNNFHRNIRQSVLSYQTGTFYNLVPFKALLAGGKHMDVSRGETQM